MKRREDEKKNDQFGVSKIPLENMLLKHILITPYNEEKRRLEGRLNGNKVISEKLPSPEPDEDVEADGDSGQFSKVEFDLFNDRTSFSS